MRALVFCLSLRACASLSEFDAWKVEYGKVYALVEEEAAASRAFYENDAMIKEQNAKNLSFWLGHNEFSDLSHENFASTHLGLVPRSADYVSRAIFQPPVEHHHHHHHGPPPPVDWVAKGKVTPVKNQGGCGSCWAFSATGAVEGAHAIATGQLLSLSEELLVQCDSGSKGCKGGNMDQAFAYVKAVGLCLEADDPYTSGGGTTGSCAGKDKSCAKKVKVSGYSDVYPNEEMMLAVVAQQPVSVSIAGGSPTFRSYKGGVLDDSACGHDLDHGVLIVGFGTDGGKDYWKVKNSWGGSWGESGYVRMVRGKNQCGIASQASIPTGAALVVSNLTAGANCDARSTISRHEGKRNCVYKDTRGHPTVGIGFNLDAFGAKNKIEAVGADYDSIRAGSSCLTDSQVMKLFEPSYQSAVSGARRAVSSYDSLCCGVQNVMTDMDYNLGDQGFRSFNTFISLINERKWAEAATDGKGTAWCREVGSRCSDNMAAVARGC